jgi:23S rRNA (adenine2503-C2)-methyltransferase
MTALLESFGEPAYRVAQLYDGLWSQRKRLEELTTLPKDLRGRLAEALPLALEPVTMRASEDEMTVKWLWQTGDGAQVETVLMRSADRATVCVSSQAGCAMGCTFCATGQAGFERHLDAAEIVEQVVRAQHVTPARVSHVVFMGMGEPLANVEPVLAALERLHDDFGLSARHLTVSTVGVVPGMRALAQHQLPVTLAVSLHAPDDALRATLVPLNRRYPINSVLDAAREYAAIKGRRVTFEYACIAGVNDFPQQAEMLAGRLTGLRGGAHVNLIPLNPTGAFEGQAPDRERINRFAARLAAAGVTVTVRRNRGVDIDAACGQLRAREVAIRVQPRPAHR